MSSDADRSSPARLPVVKTSSMSLPARVVTFGLAAFGLIMMVQWVLGSLIGIIKFGLFVAIVIAAVSWVISAKAKR